MGIVDYYYDVRKSAEIEGTWDLWVRATAAALVIASRKTAISRAAAWTEEAVECMLHVSHEYEEVLEDLLDYSPWRALKEVLNFFHDRFGDPFDYVPTF